MWSHVLSHSPSLQVLRLKIIDSEIFADQSIDLTPFTVLVGAHGSGKTAFLRTLQAALGEYTGAAQFPPFIDYHFYSPFPEREKRLKGRWEVTIREGLATHTAAVDLSGEIERRRSVWNALLTDPMIVEYANPISALSELVFLWQSMGHIDDSELINPARLNKQDVTGLRAILGRKYEEVEVHTFDNDNLDRPYAPYIRARVGEAWVDSTMMSLGELWVHHVINFVLRFASSNQVILVDEPEAFVSPRGQRAFIDEIARYALRSHVQIIIATHSPNIFESLPLKHLRICLSTHEGARLVVPKNSSQVRDAIGVETPLHGVVFVEDDMAARMLASLLDLIHPLLSRSIDVVPSGGVQQAVQAAMVMRAAARLRTAIVLDGDQQNQPPSTGDVAVMFLPGTRPPEEELIEVVSRRPESLAERLGCDVDLIYAVHDTIRFTGHQDWLRRLASRLGTPEPVLFDAILRIWLERSANRSMATELIADLARRLL
jgi:energy-coupling factor transporter ATP-binding protein EcfA2